MNADDLVAISPLVIVSATSVAVLLMIALYRSHRVSLLITLGGLGAAVVSLLPVAMYTPRQVTPLLIVDGLGLVYMFMIFAAGFVVAALSYDYLELRQDREDEYYVLLLLSVLGAAVMVISRHFLSFYLGLELLSVSLYAMIAYIRPSRPGTEAGLKYLTLAATSTGFLLFGMALVYAEIGVLDLDAVAKAVGQRTGGGLALVGFGMMLVGLGFKLSLAPFHMWTPDVYQGAPAPVTAFVATVSKGAVLGMLLRYFASSGPLYQQGPVFMLIALTAVVSMFTGNLLALMQNNVKRILAYSSISHLGYILVAFLAGGHTAVVAVTFYLAAYFVTTLGAFAVISIASLHSHDREMDTLDNYRGLFWLRPRLAIVFTLMLLSLAGIPLTAGFIGKFYVLWAGWQSALWVLLAILIVNSAIGVFYYLRIVLVMCGPVQESSDFHLVLGKTPVLSAAATFCLTLALLVLGVFPAPALHLLGMLAVPHL